MCLCAVIWFHSKVEMRLGFASHENKEPTSIQSTVLTHIFQVDDIALLHRTCSHEIEFGTTHTYDKQIRVGSSNPCLAGAWWCWVMMTRGEWEMASHPILLLLLLLKGHRIWRQNDDEIFVALLSMMWDLCSLAGERGEAGYCDDWHRNVLTKVITETGRRKAQSLEKTQFGWMWGV